MRRSCVKQKKKKEGARIKEWGVEKVMSFKVSKCKVAMKNFKVQSFNFKVLKFKKKPQGQVM